VKGKTDIGDDLRIELLSLELSQIEKRIDQAGIQNCTMAAKSLKRLSEISDLPAEDKAELDKYFDPDNPIMFMAKALQKSFRPSNYCILDNDRIDELRRIRYDIDNDKLWNVVSEETFQYQVNPTADIDEDREWLSNYLSGAPITSSLSFIRKELQVTNVIISLPIDYPAMIYSLKPTIMDGAIEAFEFDDFVTAMDIDTVKQTTRTGHLEYWLIRGEMEYIESLIPKLNFFNVSDFAFQFIGKFKLKEVRQMQKTLLKSSNPHAVLLSTLVNDKDSELAELRLITHVCEEKVIKQHEAAGDDIVKPYTYIKDHNHS
jgi:hypothetical protein